MLEFAVMKAVDVVRVREQLDSLRQEEPRACAAQVPKELSLFDLPANPAVFYGREELMASIVRLLLLDKTSHIPLLGPGGIGKTSVAAAIVNHDEVKAKFENRRMFVSCEGLTSAQGVIQALAVLLHVEPDGDIRQAVFQYLLYQSNVLLILDNLESAWDSPDRLQVEQLLAKLADLPSLSLIITMRGAIRPASVAWAETCADPLEPLSPTSARQIWDRIARNEDDALDRLLATLDGLPLAIHLMAHQGQLMSPAKLLDAYEVEKTALIETTGDGRLTSLDVSINLSLESHSITRDPDAKRLLSVLCLLPDGAPITALPVMLPSMKSTRKSAMAILSVALIFTDKHERLRVLAPIRDYVLEHLPPDEACLSELRMHFVKLTDQVANLGTTMSNETVKLLSADVGNITYILLQWWRTVGDTDIGTLFAATLQLTDFTHQTGYGDCFQLLSAARTALEAAGYRLAVAHCMRWFGEILRTQGRYEEALHNLKEAVDMFEASGEQAHAARCAWSVANICKELDRLDEAELAVDAAAKAFEALGNLVWVARCMQARGDVLCSRCRFEDALPVLEEAVTIFEANGTAGHTAQCKFVMSNALRVLGRYDEALRMVEDAKAAFEALGLYMGAAHCKQCIGNVLRMLDRTDEALMMLEEAKGEFEAMGTLIKVANCMWCIADSLLMQKHNDKGLEELAGALALYERIGGLRGAAHCKHLLARVIGPRGQYLLAAILLQQAMSTFELIDYPLGTAQCEQALAEILLSQGRYDEASQILEDVRKAFRKVGHSYGVAECTRYLAFTCLARGRKEEAVLLYMEATELYRKIGQSHWEEICQGAIDELNSNTTA